MIETCAMFCFMSPQVSKRWGVKIFLPPLQNRGAALDYTTQHEDGRHTDFRQMSISEADYG